MTFAFLSCYLWCHVTLSSKHGEAVVGCPVLELSSVHLCVLRGEEWTPIHTILNDITLATIFQLSKVGFVCIQIMSITTWKQGENVLNCLKSLQLALRAVIWGWIQITLHKSLNWSKVVIVWHSGCCFPSKCRAPLKNKAKILLMKPPVSGLHVRILQ